MEMERWRDGEMERWRDGDGSSPHGAVRLSWPSWPRLTDGMDEGVRDGQARRQTDARRTDGRGGTRTTWTKN